MLNHVMIGTNDIDRAQKFYDKVLAVLGAGPPMPNEAGSGHKRLFYIHDGHTFGVSEPINDEEATPANGATIGFRCTSPEQVKELHDVAVANGGTSIEDPPGPREGPMGTIHLSYFHDPDGNKLCGIMMGG